MARERTSTRRHQHAAGDAPSAHDGALDAGKHVVCEKPFAMSAAEAEQMRDVARA